MCAFTQRAREAGMAQSDFGRALAGAERRMERAAVELARTRRLLEREDMAGAFGSAFAFSAEVEKLALLARVLPAYTGHPKAAELTEQMLLDMVSAEDPRAPSKEGHGIAYLYPAVSLSRPATLLRRQAAGALPQLRAGLPACVSARQAGAGLPRP